MLDMCVCGLSFEDQMEILKNITINANFCQDYEVNLPQFANFVLPQTIEESQKLNSPPEVREEPSTKSGIMSSIKEHSKVYYLHRNDVRYKKVLRGCKKYYLDQFEALPHFNKKEKDSREKLNQIQTVCIEVTTSMGLYYMNQNYAIYLAAFLFPREMGEGIKKGLLNGLFTRCYNPQMKKIVDVISETIVKFSTNKLKDFLNIREIAQILDYYLVNGAQEFYNDTFYSDICVELKKKTDVWVNFADNAVIFNY